MEKGEALELMAACMTRNMKGLTAKVSGPQNAGPLDRRVRPEGQKGTPCLEEGRSPRKSAGPRKRRSTARMIAGGAWLASAGGPKGLKAFETGRSAGTGGCAHKAGDGTNVEVTGAARLYRAASALTAGLAFCTRKFASGFSHSPKIENGLVVTFCNLNCAYKRACNLR